MSQGKPRRPRGGKGKGGNPQSAGNKPGGKSGGRSGAKRGRKPSVDSRRPFWSTGDAEQAVADLTGKVRPAEDPTALVRSLGPPPLGKYGDAAHHYYDLVYKKAAQLAIAAAVSTGVLLDQDDERDGDAAGAEVAEPAASSDLA